MTFEEWIESYERDPRVQAVLAELREMIQRRYPTATFEVTRGEDPLVGIYLTPIVDIDDLDEVGDLVTPRLVDMQVDEGLRVYVFPRSVQAVSERERQMGDRVTQRAAS